MKLCYYIHERDKFFSNENLSIGDRVFPLLWGMRHKGEYYASKILMLGEEHMHGYPDRPHTIKEFYTTDGVAMIRTDRGYSPAYEYFKEIEP